MLKGKENKRQVAKERNERKRQRAKARRAHDTSVTMMSATAPLRSSATYLIGGEEKMPLGNPTLTMRGTITKGFGTLYQDNDMCSLAIAQPKDIIPYYPHKEYVSPNCLRDTWSRSGAAADAGRHNPILYGTIIYTKTTVTYLLIAHLDN